MTELAKWAWLIFICLLFAGPLTFYVAIGTVVFWVLVAWLKPEWLDKIH